MVPLRTHVYECMSVGIFKSMLRVRQNNYSLLPAVCLPGNSSGSSAQNALNHNLFECNAKVMGQNFVSSTIFVVFLMNYIANFTCS